MNIEIANIEVKRCPICGAEPLVITFIGGILGQRTDYPWQIKCDNEDYHGSPANVSEKTLRNAIKSWNEYCENEERRRGE